MEGWRYYTTVGFATIFVDTLLNTDCKLISKLLINRKKRMLRQLIYSVDISCRRWNGSWWQSKTRLNSNYISKRIYFSIVQSLVVSVVAMYVGHPLHHLLHQKSVLYLGSVTGPEWTWKPLWTIYRLGNML
jgi:hypothetical protein